MASENGSRKLLGRLKPHRILAFREQIIHLVDLGYYGIVRVNLPIAQLSPECLIDIGCNYVDTLTQFVQQRTLSQMI